MMDYPLTLQPILRRATSLFGRKEIIESGPGAPRATTYHQLHERVCRLAAALRRLGVRPGDRVGTLAWNTLPHLELYFAVPCMGAVLHTLNARIPEGELAWTIRHAEDRVLFVDPDLLGTLERAAGDLPSVRAFVLTSGDPPPSSALAPLLRLDDLVAAESAEEAWPALDERQAAAMCYTSGTTGHPKGVVYSHRALALHAMIPAHVDTLGLCEADVVLHLVPMYHALAWCLPYAAAGCGATQVLPGPHLGGARIAALIEAHGVTLSAAVPTVWSALLEALEAAPRDLSSVRLLVSGGAAAAPALLDQFDKRHGITLLHSWGMTELSPVGTYARPRTWMRAWPEAQRLAARARQGAPIPGLEIRALSAEGAEVPRDGRSVGEAWVRGASVASGYYMDASGSPMKDGWFPTGDMVTIDADGFIQVVDRAKDLVKSGGEWISTLALESALMDCEGVQEAAVIAVPHPRWQERPLACVVRRPGADPAALEGRIRAHLEGVFPRWYLPDEILMVESLPRTSVGKVDKKALRSLYADEQARRRGA